MKDGQERAEEPGLLDGKPLSRREFLRFAGIAGAVIGVGGGLSGVRRRVDDDYRSCRHDRSRFRRHGRDDSHRFQHRLRLLGVPQEYLHGGDQDGHHL